MEGGEGGKGSFIHGHEIKASGGNKTRSCCDLFEFYSPHGERYIEARVSIVFHHEAKAVGIQARSAAVRARYINANSCRQLSRVDDPCVQIKTGKDISLASFRHARNINFDLSPPLPLLPYSGSSDSVEFYRRFIQSLCTIENIEKDERNLIIEHKC